MINLFLYRQARRTPQTYAAPSPTVQARVAFVTFEPGGVVIDLMAGSLGSDSAQLPVSLEAVLPARLGRLRPRDCSTDGRGLALRSSCAAAARRAPPECGLATARHGCLSTCAELRTRRGSVLPVPSTFCPTRPPAARPFKLRPGRALSANNPRKPRVSERWI